MQKQGIQPSTFYYDRGYNEGYEKGYTEGQEDGAAKECETCLEILQNEALRQDPSLPLVIEALAKRLSELDKPTRSEV
jgi:flagellar biosynthesis/type III secretory pathway protein FliH